jgi:hypothetical protein
MRQEYMPVTDVEVAIRVPEGRQAKAMVLMRGGGEAVAFRIEDGYALGTIPKLHIAEVVHLVLSPG